MRGGRERGDTGFDFGEIQGPLGLVGLSIVQRYHTVGARRYDALDLHQPTPTSIVQKIYARRWPHRSTAQTCST